MDHQFNAQAALQLIRLPTVFTAIADVVLGMMLTQRGVTPLPKFFGLLGATCGLYLAGMVFNDVFDLQQDLQERPTGRFLPAVCPRTTAIALGLGLMLAGIASALSVSFPATLFAGAVVVAILAYDSFLKRTPLGPLAMGTCRFLSVMMAACATYRMGLSAVRPAATGGGAGMGVYIVGVTWFARTEARVSSRWQLGGGAGVVNLGFAILAGLMWTWPGEAEFAPADCAAVVHRGLGQHAGHCRPIRNPLPEFVQPMIGLFLMNYVTTAAAIVFWHTGNGTFALATAALVIPPLILRRWIPMS